MLGRSSLCRTAASGLRTSIAGPSRQPSAYVLIPRFASTSTPVPRPTPNAQASRPFTPAKPTPFSPRAPARAATPAVPSPTRQTQATWPWRLAENSPPGYTDYERTIYARPYEGPFGTRVRMMWFLVPFWGLVVGFYLTTPGLPVPAPVEGEEPVEDAKETLASTLWYYATPVGMFATSLICVAWLASPSRFVTRLTQVRRHAISSTGQSFAASKPLAQGVTPVGASTSKVAEPIIKEGEFIRMQHGGHLMCRGELMNGREIAMEDVRVSIIGNASRSPYLSLAVKPTKKISLDSVSYRLDFRDTAVVKASEDEVVLSLSRIEHVFGRLA